MPTQPKIFIVIPHYNHWDLTHARLWQLYKHGKDAIAEILVVDDCSDDEMTEGGLRWWKDFSSKTPMKIDYIRSEKNQHFLKTSNWGIQTILEKAEPEDIIILLSNDVLVMTDIFSQITETLRQPKKLVGGILLAQDTGWNKFGDTVYPYLEGWLLAATSDGWKELGGGFDERYAPSDFEDVDLSTTAISLGYELVPLNSPGLRHLGAQTIKYGEEREARTKINRGKFQEKWAK